MFSFPLVAPMHSPIAGMDLYVGRLPNLSDIVARYRQSKVATGGTAYLDSRPGAGSYAAGKGVSLAIDTPQTITFAGIDAGVTVTSHEGTATVALSSGTLSCSVAGSLYNLTLSDGTTYTCAQGVGGYIVNDLNNGINGTLVGFTLETCWTEDIEFGWDWPVGYLAADGVGTYVAGTKLPLIFVGVESGTAYVGAGTNDMPITGYCGLFAGATEYLTNAGLVGTETVVTSIGTSTPTVSAGRIDFTAGNCSYILLSNGDEIIIESRKDGAQPSVWDRINGNEYAINGATFGIDGFWSVEKDGSKLLEVGYRDNGTSLIPALLGSTTTAADGNPLTQLPGEFTGGATDLVELVPGGSSTLMRKADWLVVGEDATHIIEDVPEGMRYASDTTSPILYYRTAADSLTIGKKYRIATYIQSYTSGSIKSDTYGGAVLANGPGLFVIDAVAVSAAHVVTRATPNVDMVIGWQSVQEYIGAPSLIYAPETKAFRDLAVLAGLEDDLYTAGVPIGKTPDEWIALIPTGNIADCLFRSDVKDTFMVGWDPALTGTKITQAERYLGI